MSGLAGRLGLLRPGSGDLAPSKSRDLTLAQRRNVGILLVATGVVTLGLFLDQTPAGLHTTFRLAMSPAGHVPSVVVPSLATEAVTGVLTLLLGVLQLVRRSPRLTYLILSVGLAAFGIAFLTWAGKGQTVNFVGLLATSLIEAVPLALGAFSGVLCERSGVINIAIEGQFLIAAFFAAVVASVTHSLWLGLVAGIISGGLVGLILAVFTITYRTDQIIVGVVIDAFALGLTSFLLQALLVPNQTALNSPKVFQPIPIPLLDRIPVLGPVLFDQSVFVYLTVAILIVIQVGLFATRWGLRVRAVGEHPRAADTVGIDVNRTRYLNVMLGGLVAGVGGASFTIGLTGQFSTDMTAGLGFIALAAMIFGRWRPMGALGAALLFGFSDSLQFTFSVLNVPIPSAFLAMFPYVATIVAVAGLVGSARAPAADGQAYSRE
ncbi:MAG TPA: ABC transporter permease [Candidatus Dormibacteraeota bacterium]|jgi:simple sugar transport system permease protein|nr:ABC transporter permease [Candidatus Dormibacteraeota bacterium]